MSTISGVSSTTNPYSITNQSGFGQIVKDFNSIGNALQSGNVSSAQTALSAFQQDLQNNPQTSANQPFGTNSQANTDYQSLVGALQSGNLSNAQKAFSSLQTDLQAAQTSAKTGRGGHHHHHGAAGVSPSTLINSLTPNSASTSTTSTNLNSPAPLTNSLGANSPVPSNNATAASSAPDSDDGQDGSGLNVTA